MTTTERVVEILTKEGRYKPIANPIRIGSQEFEFTSALAATDKANDLVLVIELKGAVGNDSVIRSVLAFTRALDVIGSKRPVTVVLTSGQADKDLINAISRVCRVLPIGAPEGDDPTQVIKDWLAALLPLESPPPVGHLAEWRGALEDELKESLDQVEREQFISWALSGREAVEEALSGAIASQAEKALAEGEEKQ